MAQPYDLHFGVGFTDDAWFAGFDQAETLRRVSCPTVFVKATTRHDQQGNLLAALSDEDVARVAELLPDNEIVRVRSSHDVHFAQTAEYTAALIAFAQRARPGTSDVDAAVAGIEDRRA